MNCWCGQELELYASSHLVCPRCGIRLRPPAAAPTLREGGFLIVDDEESSSELQVLEE